MKESITKFDLEAAFKALDEIDVPATEKGIKANRPALTEIFSRKSKFESLMEEYYDVGDMEGLDDAKEAREAEVAKAKLARIEKIVDLEADSPEDLLTSYVGKYIMQCPQCMTLFYKNQEDIVASEDDPSTVNVNEVCQHCGNESGYMLIGKVGEAEPGDNFDTDALDMPAEETTEEEPVEEEPVEEESAESTDEGTEDLGDLEGLDLDLDIEEEEEKTEESFTAHEGEALVEEFVDDKELDAKLDAHNEYIEYLRAAIAQEEEKLGKATNEQVKVALQRNIDAFKTDLEAALPDAVKNDAALPDEAVEEPVDEVTEEPAEAEVQEESCAVNQDGNVLTEALHEEAEPEVSAEDFEELIKSPEFQKPITDTEAREMINAEKEDTAEDNEVSEALEEGIFDLFKSRASKADWVLKNTMIDYEKAITDKNGDPAATKENQKFACFVIVCYKNTYKNGRKIERAPKPSDSVNMVVGVKYPDVKTNYAEADKLAKGWSMKSEGGPAFIYLAKNEHDAKAEFLCQYFNGAVDAASDTLDTRIENIKKDLKGSKLRVKGGSDQSDTRSVTADSIKPGMQIKYADGSVVTVTTVAKATEPASGSTKYSITVQDASGKKPKPYMYNAKDTFIIMRDSIAHESLDALMSGLDELQESGLEALISDSLVEAYGNVAGFRLAECAYTDNKFTIDGTIYFTSGNTRKTTYIFTESSEADGKVSLRGLNEKLGREKQFVLTGSTSNKTFIAESLTYTKK